MRSKIEANEYKDYILGFIFYKFLSDKEVRYLKEQGFDVFNPAWLQVGEEWTREDIMLIDLAALSRCDAVCFLPDWAKASGCQIEARFAALNGKDVFYYKPANEARPFEKRLIFKGSAGKIEKFENERIEELRGQNGD